MLTWYDRCAVIYNNGTIKWNANERWVVHIIIFIKLQKMRPYCNLEMSRHTRKNIRQPASRYLRNSESGPKNTPYEDKDYNSNDGMLTTVWGPGIWHYLHTMSFNYPINPTAEDKQHYRNFVLELKYVLPCGKCRKNLAKNFKKLPLTMSHMKSRDTFSRYIYDLHETVNRMLNKHSGLTYDNVRERYEHFRARCAKPLKRICTRKKKDGKKSDKGCVVPLYGNKAKCVLKIIPQDVKCETIQIDKSCIKRKGTVPVE